MWAMDANDESQLSCTFRTPLCALPVGPRARFVIPPVTVGASKNGDRYQDPDSQTPTARNKRRKGDAADQTGLMGQQFDVRRAQYNAGYSTDTEEHPEGLKGIELAMKKVFWFDAKEFYAATDPMRMTWAAFKRNSGQYIDNEKTCRFASMMVPIEDDGTTYNFDWPEMTNFIEDGGYSFNLGSMGAFPQDKKEYDLRTDYAQGTWVYSPNIAPLIQQHYIRYKNWKAPPPVAPGYVEASLPVAPTTAYSLHNTTPYDIEKPRDYSEVDLLHQFQLETFTAYNWRTTVPPQCAERSTCASCTVMSVCSWCDLSRANLGADLAARKAGWYAHSRTASLDGSGCGIPPLVCALMGGDPVVNQCRKQV